MSETLSTEATRKYIDESGELGIRAWNLLKHMFSKGCYHDNGPDGSGKGRLYSYCVGELCEDCKIKAIIDFALGVRNRTAEEIFHILRGLAGVLKSDWEEKQKCLDRQQAGSSQTVT